MHLLLSSALLPMKFWATIFLRTSVNSLKTNYTKFGQDPRPDHVNDFEELCEKYVSFM